ncbi:peptidoglycan editing factor PgeF [Steroidobacter sp.]|uniref:peptidoglycan editing factor PgeF n=1 Tax=Steroidobacter sp. TaxID=1978227 RepID=UPI001A4E672C|nr:peptidoglycan editing factor PgeF [Steroidobacter sp.]MBL8268399.1 peptidoglycan editing factor PgeF [Steroidobacter sp.]
MAEWITPDWPAPPQVKAAATLRTGGVSEGAFSSLNLGSHVGDEPAAVLENRRLLRAALRLPAEPAWLNQVHGIQVVDANAAPPAPPAADASTAFGPGAVCVVMTADCLPVLFCDRQGTRVGAAHAGWRGLAGGVLGATIKALGVPPAQLLAWLGPAIEQNAFEVGEEVHEAFSKLAAENAAAFKVNARGRWQADLYQLARNELARLGVTAVYGGGFECFADNKRFFSYRRASRTGRMASLAWLS